MNSVLAIAEQMLADSIIKDSFSVAGESKIRTLLITFSTLMGVSSIGFFVYGSYTWLSNNYEIVTVMFAMGGIFFLLSIISGIVIYNITLLKRKKIQTGKENFIAIAKDTFEIFQQELETPINDNPKTALLIASISGYLAGERFL